MRLFLICTFLLLIPAALFARVIIVDGYGSGDFTTIVAAVDAAVNNDTIKVLPYTPGYDGEFTISRQIVLMGSGYEATAISSNHNPTITMNAGKVMWFAITSGGGTGVNMAAGQLTNCVIRGCTGTGVQLLTNSTAIISNCVFYGNGNTGIERLGNNTSNTYNCISWANYNYGFANISVHYSCGSFWYANGVGNINTDPQFTSSSDYHISPLSPCWNTGRPDVFDPDGSRSDMGYFGGPDCPIYPVVTDIQITPLPGGGVEVQATGKANY